MGKYSKDKRDIYYRKAKELGFRARSAFKLLQIDEEFNILKGVKRAVDLCAAPGSWSQVLSRKLYADNPSSKDVKIVAVDLQPMAPIKGVLQIEGDITSQQTAQQIIDSFDGGKADLVVCDGAPDVTGMHDIDEYIQSQLILSALNITTYLLRKDGNFVCKIFRGRDINILYTKLEIFFNSISVAKPKSSRNSSIEAFIVCQGYNPPHDYVPDMNILQFNNIKNIENVTENEENFKRNKFNHQKTILFVACGDLSAYDADANYPLLDDTDKAANAEAANYDYVDPVQRPINPNYKDFMALKRGDVFSNQVSLLEQQYESDMDEENVIHARDAPHAQQTQSTHHQKRARQKQRQKHLERKYDDMEEDEHDDDLNEDRMKRRALRERVKERRVRRDSVEEEELGSRSNWSEVSSPGKLGRSQRSLQGRDRNKSRNQIAFYATVTAAAVVVWGLAKFYYQTHQAGDNGASNSAPKANNAPSLNIDFRKK
eukprot:CAMPEP_0197026232 /NCGR_PEP_ID=MMETSP1384-20130603/6372_1 /TAXON_ID=29189 /ORGANISM="Ammonia sp." /LENGTH=485 /DNA_ID=CAMNT_0042454871 /DNA_START=17 /DNA_END=1474 /DNA_ORIENTATION=-